MASASALIALFLTVLPASEGEAANADLLQAAETAFAAGVEARRQGSDAKTPFQEAARFYTALLERGVRNPALLRNLGNASLLGGDVPRAVLAYRNGLRVSSGDRLLQANLEFARAQVDYPEQSSFARPPSDQRPPWLLRLPVSLQFFGVLVSYALLWLAFTRWWTLRDSRSLLTAALAAAFTALLGANLFVENWQTREEMVHPLVVIADDGVLIRTGNGLSYPPRYETPLNRGVEARLLYARGEWLQIQLSGGEVGWAPAAYTIRSLE